MLWFLEIFVGGKRPPTPCPESEAVFWKKRGRKESPCAELEIFTVSEDVVVRRKRWYSALLLFLLCLCRATILPLL
jgi:hypothetical protein